LHKVSTGPEQTARHPADIERSMTPNFALKNAERGKPSGSGGSCFCGHRRKSCPTNIHRSKRLVTVKMVSKNMDKPLVPAS